MTTWQLSRDMSRAREDNTRVLLRARRKLGRNLREEAKRNIRMKKDTSECITEKLSELMQGK